MQPSTIEALVIIALVLSPGYVFTQVARRLIAHVPETTDLRFLLTVVTWGTVIQAIAFPFWTIQLLDFYFDQDLPQHLVQVSVWVVTVCLLLPVVLGIAVGRLTLLPWVDNLLDKIGLGYIDRMPSAWDYLVRNPRGNWVRIYLRDNQGVIAGKFSVHSVASLDPKRADLYLEEAWLLDENGRFDRTVPASRGVWIAHNVMAYVDFLNLEEEFNGPDTAIPRDESRLDA